MPSKWKVEFGEESGKLPNPMGYTSSRELAETESGGKKREVDYALKQKKVWEIASSPLKNVGMMAFMMWMTGNGLNIFSIGMVFTGVMQPFKAIAGSGAMFARFADKKTDTFLPRMQYCAIQTLAFFVALYKLNKLGLLPTHTSDWISVLSTPEAVEYSSGGASLM
eukprot:CAMPEP_0197844680 /NCGR_PEP_ID=MMETSP1438-20131217/1669_1 /TAXON_ID=1461541 /ORGANISM="Pterosperma sp., Strain CCMP1384" /LENGTH=165 /DNA_ID=CAMNT_0043455615 /DNA_START=88 /DNA_END=585 /DNA_ORIENTATION=+